MIQHLTYSRLMVRIMGVRFPTVTRPWITARDTQVKVANGRKQTAEEGELKVTSGRFLGRGPTSGRH